MTEICPECGEEFQRIGHHWSIGDCSYPSFSDYQKEVITGLLMGDGCLGRSRKSPYVRCHITSPNYLRHIDNKFGILGLGVSMVKTAKESAAEDRVSGFRPNAKAKKYSDVYGWCSRNHPELNGFADWYSAGEKVWPADIELSPTVLRHWYCNDGHFDTILESNTIEIAMANESENTEKVSKYFENVGLPAPSNYKIYEYERGLKSCTAQFTKDQSKELFEYMRHSLPDFEYKFPDKYC